MAGAIYHNGQWYGLGGSDVEANPTGSATDTIEKIGIDGTVYEVTDADAVHTSDIGTANGVAELDANGAVPKAELPSDVVYDNPTFSEAGSRTNIASGESFATILGKIKKFFTDLKAVAFSGSYNDLDNKPTIPTVNNGTLTIQKNGSTVQTFTANQSGNATANITVPTKVSELQNDSEYATETDIEGFKTVTGKYITVTDAASLPAESYSLTLSPVQDLNGYEYPWAAGAGKNKFDLKGWLDSVSATYTQNGDSFTITSQTALYTTPFVFSDTDVQVTFSFDSFTNGTATYARLSLLDSNNNVVATRYAGDVTPVTGIASKCRFDWSNAGSFTINKPQIELGSQKSDYVPYSNICPIHGADEVGVRVRGKNFLQVQSNSGTFGQFTFTVNKDSDNNVVSVTLNGTASETLYYQIMSGFVARKGIPYTLSGVPSGVSGIIIYNDNTGKMWRTSDTPTVTFDTETTMPIYIRVASGTTVSNVVLKPMIEIGAQATEFEPYKPTISTTIPLPSTVYGGSVENDGSGSVTMENIASYNGETINEPWISSMDKYEAGATPTTGAQVVYPLATPTSLSVTPFPQTLLEGVNNVWAEMKENSVVIDNAQQSLSYQPQNIVGELRQEIEAKPDSFADLTDTAFSNLANGQIPKWNSTTNKWENANESGGGGSSSLSGLSDVNLTSPADGQILKFDSATSKWVNANEYSYTLPTAAANTLGGIKVGSRLSIDANGVLSANDQSYTLPTASASTKGGVKIGDNLEMNGEVLSATLPAWTKIWNFRSGASSATIPSGTTEIMLAIVYTYDTISYAGSAIYPFNSGYVYNLEYYESYSSKWMTASIQGNGSYPTFSYANGGTIPSYYDFEIWVR